MYCVKCGVKLADTEKQCPLCGTVAFHPDIERTDADPLYPPQRYPSSKRGVRGGMIIVTAAFLLPMFITLICDYQLNGTVTWADYVVGALIVAYTILVLPYWFRKPNPVIFVPCAFAAAGLYLLYINLVTGGSWFLGFALPVTASVCAIVTAVTALLRYLKRGRLYIFGGAFIAFGAVMPLTEFLLTRTFDLPHYIGWSPYPFGTFLLLGGTLLFLAICPGARESFERKFFL